MKSTKQESKNSLKTNSYEKDAGAPNKRSAKAEKSAKFNEVNVIETLHPIGKDYGFMRIDEPKTPFVREHYDEHKNLNIKEKKTTLDVTMLSYHKPNFQDYKSENMELPKAPRGWDNANAEHSKLNTEVLIRKLNLKCEFGGISFGDDDIDEDLFHETIEEQVRRLEFERRRKMHSREYDSVPLARKLIQEEFGDADLDVDADAGIDSKDEELTYNDQKEDMVLSDSLLESIETLSLNTTESNKNDSIDNQNRFSNEYNLQPGHTCYGRDF